MTDRTLHGHLPRRGLLAAVVGMASVAGVATAFAAASCDAIKQLAIEHTAIDAAEPIPAGVYKVPGATEIKDVPAFCRVHGAISPVPGSHIGFELWLPDAGWNGKLEMFGNGGYSSKIAYGNLAAQINPSNQLAMLSAAVLNACRGRDGGLATDKFLTAPEACDFQPKDILCKAGDAPDCLTEEQAAALATMYGGARNTRTGEVIYS